jgi:SAM-dependent methyltransferase
VNGALIIQNGIERIRRGWGRLNDLLLNIHTVGEPIPGAKPAGWWRGARTEKCVFQDNYGYASADYQYIRKVIRRLNLKSDDIVYDLGCGMGRVICLFSRQRIRKCVGVELMEDLYLQARANVSRVRGRRTPVEVICQDAALTDVAAGTVFYIFNPFGEKTLQTILENIRRSLPFHPRKVRIVYHNSVHKDVLDSCEWLRLYDGFKTLWGTPVHFYESTVHVAAGGASGEGEPASLMGADSLLLRS